MNASKENARKAIEGFNKILMATTTNGSCATAAKHISEFLVAAERKLPSEAAYSKDRGRKRKAVA